ncbi:MAG: PAS domain-containing sensor histidine kinase [Herbaspirillum sp.]
MPDIPFRALVEQSIAGIYVIQDECFVYVNATYAAFTGYTQDEMIGMPLKVSVHPDYYEQVMTLYNRRINDELVSAHFVTWGRHKIDGHLVRIEVQGSRLLYRGRPAVLGIGIDATERLQREEDLRCSRQELQTLTTHMNSIREEQRARFARELHDVLGGMLTSIKMDVTRVQRRADTPELKEITDNLLILTQDTIDTVRRLSEELHPAALEHLGLTAAIRKEFAEFGERYNIECELDSPDLPFQLSFFCATGIYRIFQEALTNIALHASATKVILLLDATEDEIMMEIIDNGCGIDISRNRLGALGILSMRERARELGGKMELAGHSSQGTRLYLEVPIGEKAK